MDAAAAAANTQAIPSIPSLDARDIAIISTIGGFVMLVGIASFFPPATAKRIVGWLSLAGLSAFVVAMFTLSAIAERRASKKTT